jgi:hypothetical protein
VKSLLLWAYFGLLAAGPAAGVGILAAPAATAAPSPTPTAGPLTDQQQRKLDLEIKKLEQDTGGPTAWRQWLTAGSVAVAFLGGAWTVFQYFRDQHQTTRLRLEEQFGDNLEALARFPEPGNSTGARVITALANLQRLVPRQPDARHLTTQVTDVIATAVRSDLDFEDLHHIRFDALCLERWPDYGAWLNAHPGERDFILYRYQQGVRVLYDLDPDYYRTMRLNDSGGFIVQRFVEEQRYLRFQRLVAGYQSQLRNLTDPAARDRASAEFGAAIDNQALAAGLF